VPESFAVCRVLRLARVISSATTGRWRQPPLRR
jgi:hypothetical protein